MARLTSETLRQFLNGGDSPMISIYQPTHRTNPDARQDPIRYKNLLSTAEASLREKFPTREVQALLAPFRALVDDTSFWSHQEHGLAILGSANSFEIFQLQRPVEELVVVADSFHLKPLIRILQSADRYQVLCLDRRKARILEGNRDLLVELDTGDLPMTLKHTVGEEKTEPHMAVAVVMNGGGAGAGAGSGAGGLQSGNGVAPAVIHGHGGREDEVKKDTERFFRAIDREVLANFSRPSGLPLILAALTEYHAEFRKLSHNPFLQSAGVSINPSALSAEQLRDDVWKAVEPIYFARLAHLSDAYLAASAHEHGLDNPHDVAKAIVAGRVGTLLVEADRISPGRFDAATGEIHIQPLKDPAIDDLFDDFAEAVLKTGGEVVIVPADKMPTKTGVAATLRY
ncbi:hypothetical protein EP7_004772 [Isosphaeraceae bacterium EP7]